MCENVCQLACVIIIFGARAAGRCGVFLLLRVHKDLNVEASALHPLPVVKEVAAYHRVTSESLQGPADKTAGVG